MTSITIIQARKPWITAVIMIRSCIPSKINWREKEDSMQKIQTNVPEDKKSIVPGKENSSEELNNSVSGQKCAPVQWVSGH